MKDFFVEMDRQIYILDKFEELIKQDKKVLQDKLEELKKAVTAYNVIIAIDIDSLDFDAEEEEAAFHNLQILHKDYELLMTAYGLGMFDITDASLNIEEGFKDYIEQAPAHLKPVIEHIQSVAKQLQKEYKTLIEEER